MLSFVVFVFIVVVFIVFVFIVVMEVVMVLLLLSPSKFRTEAAMTQCVRY